MERLVFDAVITSDDYLSYKVYYRGKLFLKDESVETCGCNIDVAVMDKVLELQYFGNLPMFYGVKRKDDCSNPNHARYWLYVKA